MVYSRDNQKSGEDKSLTDRILKFKDQLLQGYCWKTVNQTDIHEELLKKLSWIVLNTVKLNPGVDRKTLCKMLLFLLPESDLTILLNVFEKAFLIDRMTHTNQYFDDYFFFRLETASYK